VVPLGLEPRFEKVVKPTPVKKLVLGCAEKDAFITQKAVLRQLLDYASWISVQVTAFPP